MQQLDQPHDAGTPPSPPADFTGGSQRRVPARLWGTCPTPLGVPPCPERRGCLPLTLASRSPRPRGTSRSFSLSTLLPSRRTGMRSPTASCGTDNPPTERSILKENRKGRWKHWLQRHRLACEPPAATEAGGSRVTPKHRGDHHLPEPQFAGLRQGSQGCLWVPPSPLSAGIPPLPRSP